MTIGTQHPNNSPTDYERLSAEEKSVLQSWIVMRFVSAKVAIHGASSYGLKHDFEESEKGFYITNGQFKGAMLAAGHVPVYENALNWHFRIKLVKGQRR